MLDQIDDLIDSHRLIFNSEFVGNATEMPLNL